MVMENKNILLASLAVTLISMCILFDLNLDQVISQHSTQLGVDLTVEDTYYKTTELQSVKQELHDAKVQISKLKDRQLAERTDNIRKQFRSGRSKLQDVRKTLSLCSTEQPDQLVPLFDSIAAICIDNRLIDQKTVQDEMENIRAGQDDMEGGSAYLLLLLADVDPRTLPRQTLYELSRVCTVIRRARITLHTVSERVDGWIDVSSTDLFSAGALYAGLLITAHSAQGSLHTVREVRVTGEPGSIHSATIRLPTILAACTPNMTALTQVIVPELASCTDLGEVCDGLVASGVPRLTHLTLEGRGDLRNVACRDLGPVARVIRMAAQLRELELGYIHCGEERQLHALCESVEEAAPQLTHLVLKYCFVSAQQYIAVLLPALHKRRVARGARLHEVQLWWEETEGVTDEEWDQLEMALIEVAERVGLY